VTHVFVAPHPDDVALSCGGLIASLRGSGQSVTILTVFSGTGAAARLTPYQREALGFGDPGGRHVANVVGPRSARGHTNAGTGPAGDQSLDATRGDVEAGALAVEIAAERRREDERYARFAGASIALLDLPDAVFRGYEGDDQLLGMPRPDDTAPVDLLLREIARQEPRAVYLPLGIGSHVDHQLVREVGAHLLRAGRGTSGSASGGTSGSVPGSRELVTYYEDFPYAWWNDFRQLEDLPAGTFGSLPADVSLTPELADIGDHIERKIRGIELYESQLDRLFGGGAAMGDAVRGFGARVAALGGRSGFAERYWASTRR
jgi:LmbE family N-acetylglucosaminyl deacetylase